MLNAQYRYNLILQRDHIVYNVKCLDDKKAPEASTVGLMGLYDYNTLVFTCYTIETGSVSTAMPGQDQRILPGEYRLRYSKTSVPLPASCNKEGLLLFQPANPKFELRRIFIHAGNYPQDSEGCILLNGGYDMTLKKGYGVNSRSAVAGFYKVMQQVDLTMLCFTIREINNDGIKW